MDGLRVAFSPALGGSAAVDPAVAAAVRRAVDLLAGLGASVEEIDPGIEDPVEAFHTLWFSGAARVVQPLGPDRWELLDPGAARDLRAQGARTVRWTTWPPWTCAWRSARPMGRFHSAYDLLVTPTLPITAFEAGVEVPRARGTAVDGLDAVHLPLQHDPAARREPVLRSVRRRAPVGLQLVAARHADALVCGRRTPCTGRAADGVGRRWRHGCRRGRVTTAERT